MQHMLNWNDLKYLLATVQAGSYNRAAEELGVNRTTIARRIAALEQQLDAPLLESGNGGYRLTEEGRLALDSARRFEQEAHQLESRLTRGGGELRGSLRVAAPLGLGPEFMAELAAFGNAYPAVRVELINTQDPVSSLNQRQADVGIAVTHDLPDYLSGRRVAVLQRAVYASERYLADHPATLPLGEHRWIGWGREMAHTEVARWMQHHLPAQTAVGLRVNSWHALREAVRQGLGVSHLWCFLAGDIGDLRAITPVTRALDIGLWLCHHGEVRNNRRVSAFVDTLAPLLQRRAGDSD
ncbi:LysR family transcriptional regulator [Parahaliea mediterranea]|uniref:LysR family transcriptional regulator n=1 Tax=Parahaliea mediterranea TaxID=651086 RepID=A0A939DE11_9GAMM|nr:LysR family transcriptional regulator [Parahaliea mediterranea]MBN7796508.1 LysR family transcriptional regulator [Parahaliea mediterranea]